jgi:hypothetical protein
MTMVARALVGWRREGAQPTRRLLALSGDGRDKVLGFARRRDGFRFYTSRCALFSPLFSSQANLSATLHQSGTTVDPSPVVWVEDNPRK